MIRKKFWGQSPKPEQARDLEKLKNERLLTRKALKVFPNPGFARELHRRMKEYCVLIGKTFPKPQLSWRVYIKYWRRSPKPGLSPGNPSKAGEKLAKVRDAYVRTFGYAVNRLIAALH